MDITSTDDLKVSIATKIPNSLVAKIDYLAARDGITRSQLVADTLAKAFGETDNPEAKLEFIRSALLSMVKAI